MLIFELFGNVDFSVEMSIALSILYERFYPFKILYEHNIFYFREMTLPGLTLHELKQSTIFGEDIR